MNPCLVRDRQDDVGASPKKAKNTSISNKEEVKIPMINPSEERCFTLLNWGLPKQENTEKRPSKEDSAELARLHQFWKQYPQFKPKNAAMEPDKEEIPSIDASQERRFTLPNQGLPKQESTEKRPSKEDPSELARLHEFWKQYPSSNQHKRAASVVPKT